MSDNTAMIINVDHDKLHIHVKISKVNTKRMEIMYITYKPVEGGKRNENGKKNKLITRKT